MTDRFVLDASVGVKWFRFERGSDAARDFLSGATRGSIRVAVPTHFVHEVLSAIQRRDHLPARVVEAWDIMLGSGVDVIPLGDDVVREAVVQCETLRCSFYDALAPAVATLLEATLVSADVKAHSDYPGVVLIG